MKFVNFFKLAMMAVAAAAVIGCEPQDQTEDSGNGTVEVTENLQFELEVTEVLATSAKIKVSHNGESTASDTWYGFVTTDTGTDVETLIKSTISDLLAAGNGEVKGLKTQRQTSVALSNLTEDTDYKYIVFGLKSDGESYGESNYVEFITTSDTPDGYEETDTWTITYGGRVTDEDGQKLEEFDVQTESDMLYYVSSYPAYLVTEYGYSHTELAADVVYTVSSALQMGYQLTDILSAGSNKWYEPRLQSDAYYVYAVGFLPNGTSSYTYSVAEITVEEETALPEYEKWLGTWTLTSSPADDFANSSVPSATYTVNIEHYDNNYMYAVTGWETVGAETDMSEVLGDLAFPAYFVDGELVFEEYDITPLTFTTGGEATHVFGLYAYGDIVMEGQNYPGQIVGFSGYGIPMAKTSSAGSSIRLLGQTYEEPGLTIDYKAMGYMAIPYAQNEYVQFFNYPMFFPITMEKVETASLSSANLQPAVIRTDLGLNKKESIKPHKLVKKASF